MGGSDVDSGRGGARSAGAAADRRTAQWVDDPRSTRYARTAVATTVIHTPMIEQGITRTRSVMSRSCIRSGSLFTRNGIGEGQSSNDEVHFLVGQAAG
jgi:hypothetical protein